MVKDYICVDVENPNTRQKIYMCDWNCNNKRYRVVNKII